MVPRIVVRLAAAALGLMLVMAAKPVKSAVATSAPSPTTAPAAVRPPAEAGPFRPSDLVELAQIDPTMKLDIRYARPDNFTGKAVYAQARAFLQRKAAEALVRVQRSLRERGYGLIIFDGYRPWSVTRRFWDLTPADKKVFVADPAKGSRHNRGAAVDVSLYDLASGREVAMPSAYDDFSEKAFATYTGGGAESRAHRGLLRDAMEREGFFVYPEEWWHFDYKDWRDYPILDVPLEDLPAMALSAGVPDTIEWSRAELVDLTWTFDQTTLYWPTSPTHFELQRLAHGPTQAGYFYSANSFCAPEHGGTHLDAPVHFAEKGDTADQVPLGRLVAPGLVIDISPQAAVDADYRLRREDVLAWEKKHGRIPDGSIVLLRTGWGTRWPDRARVFGDATPNDATHLHFPGYGEDAADLLVKERAVAALGIDTPSLDYGPSKTFGVHVLAMGANVPGLENVAHLERVPETGALIVALPMKIGDGSGAPLRIVAILPAGAAHAGAEAR
jgi:D-alanyl-D-alanine dipeptidase/kynurenine formamidase